MQQQMGKDDLRSLIEVGCIRDEETIDGIVFKLRSLTSSERIELSQFPTETTDEKWRLNYQMLAYSVEYVNGKPLEFYHPDKTNGDKDLEELFKKITDSNNILNDEKKRAEYDKRTSNSWSSSGFSEASNGFGFDDFVRNFSDSDFRRRSSERARRTQGKTHQAPPTTDHLNIHIHDKLELVS